MRINQSIHPSAAEQKIFSTVNSDKGLIDRMDRTAAEDSVKEQIDYDDLMSHKDETVRDMVDEVKDLIVDVICGERNIFNGGQRVSDETAKSALKKLTSEHILYVLHNIENYSGVIKRIDRFLLTSLYNAAYTMTNSTFSGFKAKTGISLVLKDGHHG